MLLNGSAVLREIDSFLDERGTRHEATNAGEQRTINIVRRDAQHAVLQQHDARMFGEFDRLKLVELEYLYQLRGIRQVAPSAVFGEGYAGYGNGWTGSKIHLLYPQDRKRAGRSSREPMLPINKVEETATMGEQLVPLRIHLTTEKFRLKDRLLWNADDTTIPLELFVENVLEDYGLPLALGPQVAQSLQDQISKHLPHIYPTVPEKKDGDGQSSSEDVEKQPGATQQNDATAQGHRSSMTSQEDVEMPDVTEASADAREIPAKPPQSANGVVDESSRAGSGLHVQEADHTEQDMSATRMDEAEIPEQVGSNEPQAPTDDPSAWKSRETDASGPDVMNDDSEHHAETDAANGEPAAKTESPVSKPTTEYDWDMRVTIKIDITVGQHQLVDQFEWDINNKDNDPEMFGVILANELSLPMEFGPAVAHAIREQTQAYTRALFRTGYQFDGTVPRDQQLQSELSPPVDEHAFLRLPELLPLFSPAINEARAVSSAADAHEQEQERRELRSRRRQGRTSRRGMHHDPRSASNAAAIGGEVVFTHQDAKAPVHSTPIYSSILPGGLDRNLDILHMTAYRHDEAYGGERQDLAYYFQRQRRERGVPSASQFESSLVTEDKPRWIVKLRLPRGVPT